VAPSNEVGRLLPPFFDSGGPIDRANAIFYASTGYGTNFGPFGHAPKEGKLRGLMNLAAVATSDERDPNSVDYPLEGAWPSSSSYGRGCRRGKVGVLVMPLRLSYALIGERRLGYLGSV
jgi:hypothetical protein